eukprot:TRINITY_DN4771_c0_g1_i3.p1 TRINITY_DN4771_c0_g1~~TRINITY_DN4771_c0_g1_i3.p1  ORF type:complete len:194 (-),score=36.54 TRINITY_DN4771_c0_g1_i3:1346-1927(-)
MERGKAIEDFIRKSEEDAYRRAQEEQAAKEKKRLDDKANLTVTLQEQIRQKEQERERQRSLTIQNTESIVRKSEEYSNWAKSVRDEKIESQRRYKEFLDLQRMEKTKASPTSQTVLTGPPLLLPGLSNSKYIHPYSPEARYADVINFKVRHSQNQGIGAVAVEEVPGEGPPGRQLTENRSGYLASIAHNSLLK